METGSAKPKFYGLVEFPYPSGQGLHVGHARPYTEASTHLQEVHQFTGMVVL